MMSSRTIKLAHERATLWARLRSILYRPIIVSTPGVNGGRPRIDGRRITVAHIALDTQQGKTPAQIAEDYDLSLRDIMAALRYYQRHRAEIDASIRASDAYVEEMMRTTPSRLPRP